MSKPTGWVWRETEIRTMGDLMDAITKIKTKEEADEFVAAYAKVNEHAPSNIGYMLGYLDKESRDRLYRLFEECSHPVFGHNFGRGSEPTAEGAFEAGLAMGKAALGLPTISLSWSRSSSVVNSLYLGASFAPEGDKGGAY